MARKAHWTPWHFETQAIAAIGCIGTAWGGSLGVILPFRFFMSAVKHPETLFSKH